jgi:predicted signal transduction protein with EAL and GGDEF domain
MASRDRLAPETRRTFTIAAAILIAGLAVTFMVRTLSERMIAASIGLAVMPLHVGKGDALVAAADAALYQAKGQGRNRVMVSDRRTVTSRLAEVAFGLTGTEG